MTSGSRTIAKPRPDRRHGRDVRATGRDEHVPARVERVEAVEEASRLHAGTLAARRPADGCRPCRRRAPPRRHAPASPSSSRRAQPLEPGRAQPDERLGQLRDRSSPIARPRPRTTRVAARAPTGRASSARSRRRGRLARRSPVTPEPQAPDALRRPAPRPARSTRRRGSCSPRRPAGRGSMRSSTENPLARNSRIHSPYGSWNVTTRPRRWRASRSSRGRAGRRRARRRAPRRCASIGERVAEREQPARPKQPRDLGHGPVRVGEGHRPVVAEDDVERRVGQRHLLGAALDQREVDAGLGHQPPGVLELARRQVERRPSARRAWPARSTTAPRRSRIRGRREPATSPRTWSPPRGSGTCPTQLRRYRRAGPRGVPGIRRCSRPTSRGCARRARAAGPWG